MPLHRYDYAQLRNDNATHFVLVAHKPDLPDDSSR